MRLHSGTRALLDAIAADNLGLPGRRGRRSFEWISSPSHRPHSVFQCGPALDQLSSEFHRLTSAPTASYSFSRKQATHPVRASHLETFSQYFLQEKSRRIVFTSTIDRFSVGASFHRIRFRTFSPADGTLRAVSTSLPCLVLRVNSSQVTFCPLLRYYLQLS